MSKNQIMLCSSLLKEHFGEIVQKVAIMLKKYGSRPLRIIAQETMLPLRKVKQSLRVLIQHDMAEFELNKKGFVEYTVKLENILLIHRYPRYIYCAKTFYGDIGELLIEEILNNGMMTMEVVIQKVSERLAEATGDGKADIPISSVKEKFNNLVQSHFIKRCPMTEWEENSLVPSMYLQEHEMFRICELEIYALNEASDDEGLPPAKKLKLRNTSTKETVYWRVNFDRFHQYFRDQCIIKAVISRFDNKTGDVVRALLHLVETRSNPWVETTNPVPRHELLQMLIKESNITADEMDAYLAVLIDDSTSFVSRVDERGGGMYVVNIKKSLQKLSEAIAISVVQDKFGSKCCRVFRFVTKLYEIPRTPDHAPSRTFYLFHVDLVQLCRSLLDRCYKVMFNSICHREFINREHKRLLEKKQRVEAITATLQQSGADSTQIQEVC
ncbi:DNA-directed RNA polymerase III subunit RPC3-like [Centruroides sculpturatus]|uniref:DNA-directed RNA polymerase III subunit RPC3-like n=1 Tax=Centruroides sculpturatus TaxID=218467 RepID=UPI000C6D845C|nr:DNA-directed RNA polymerase III subunit RPC3-like [Centruroides sculpturatus]